MVSGQLMKNNRFIFSQPTTNHPLEFLTLVEPRRSISLPNHPDPSRRMLMVEDEMDQLKTNESFDFFGEHDSDSKRGGGVRKSGVRGSKVGRYGEPAKFSAPASELECRRLTSCNALANFQSDYDLEFSLSPTLAAVIRRLGRLSSLKRMLSPPSPR